METVTITSADVATLDAAALLGATETTAITLTAPVALSRAEAEAVERAHVYRCRGKLSASAEEDKIMLLRSGRLEEAAEVDAAGRVPCGSDAIESIICAGPYDGELHPYVCPKCGASGWYRAAFHGPDAVNPAEVQAAPEAAQ